MKYDPLADTLRMLPLVKPSLLHLKRVTGKWNVWDINPLEEKRWSNKCWECYGLLKDFQTALLGANPSDVKAEILREMRPDDGLIGHIKTGTWEPFAGAEKTKERFKVKTK
jgi:hypothetical protein